MDISRWEEAYEVDKLRGLINLGPHLFVALGGRPPHTPLRLPAGRAASG